MRFLFMGAAALASLLWFMLVPHALAEVSRSQLNAVLIGNSKGDYSRARRNIAYPSAAQLVSVEGRKALAITLTYADGGHPDDWNRLGGGSKAQRYEFAEKRAQWMRSGKTYWLRKSIFIPEGTRVRDVMHVTDIKRNFGSSHAQIYSIHIGGKDLRLKHMFGQTMQCSAIREASGGTNTYCNEVPEFLVIGPVSGFSGRWLDFVYRVEWHSGQAGRFHIWLNGDLLFGVAGVTAHQGRIFEDKFGLYRLWFGAMARSAPDVTVYFADIGKGNSCKSIAVSDCAKFEGDASKFGHFKIRKRWETRDDQLDRILRAGGKIIR